MLRWGHFGPQQANERQVNVVLCNLEVTFAFKSANRWRQIIIISKLMFNHVSYCECLLSPGISLEPT